MKITFYADNKILECQVGDFVKDIPASSIVRNELNRRRALHDKKQVVHAITYDRYNKPPIMPRPFPVGVWDIHAPVKVSPDDNEWLDPYFIPTSAVQRLDIWRLDRADGYDMPTGAHVIDKGYGLHYSESITTLGCIRIHNVNDLLWLVNVIGEEIERGHQNTITV